MNNMWYFYVVECRDGSLYAGITKDIERRINEHNNTKRGAKYTRSRRPVKLLMFKEHKTHSDAAKEEWSFKRLSRSKSSA